MFVIDLPSETGVGDITAIAVVGGTGAAILVTVTDLLGGGADVATIPEAGTDLPWGGAEDISAMPEPKAELIGVGGTDVATIPEFDLPGGRAKDIATRPVPVTDLAGSVGFLKRKRN